DRADVLRRRAAATPRDIDPTVLRPFAELPRHGVRCVLVLAECIWQAGVGMAGGIAFGEPRELFHVGPQFLCAERAVQADCEWPRVAHGVVERFRRLAGQRAPGGVRDRARNDERQPRAVALESVVYREEGGL